MSASSNVADKYTSIEDFGKIVFNAIKSILSYQNIQSSLETQHHCTRGN